jgi:hypothetical protein
MEHLCDLQITVKEYKHSVYKVMLQGAWLCCQWLLDPFMFSSQGKDY